MTPEARYAAAAELLDTYLSGQPVEKALTNWARRSRFAGSGDRAAIRDHVFGAIRRRRSATALGGSETGRGLVIGLLRSQGIDPEDFLTGGTYALESLTPEEASLSPDPTQGETLDCPEWLLDDLRESLGKEFAPVMERMRSRAELFLRVNEKTATVSQVQAELAEAGIDTTPHPLADHALRVTTGPRRVHLSAAYLEGRIEIQDVASQAVSNAIPLPEDGRILDYCAGGGGKALALAARGADQVFVHDTNVERMKDIPDRASRAGVRLQAVSEAEIADMDAFQLIVADVPCSGSGAWRRQPEAKWRLDAGELDRLKEIQAEIFETAADLAADGGRVAYLTCSVLRQENEQQIARFLERNPSWGSEIQRRVSPTEGGDGFFLAILKKQENV